MKKDDFIINHATLAETNNRIDPKYYSLYNVKRGLRNKNGIGVLVGLSQVSSVIGYQKVNGKKVPQEGRLIYRGYDIQDIIHGFQSDKRYGFEETIYLLIFGELPTHEELQSFRTLLGTYRCLPEGFVENMILKNPSSNVMNKLQRSILVLYSFDEDPENLDIVNVLEESLQLIARFPTIVAYGYQAKAHYFDHESLYLHAPQKDLSTAEYLLYLIRPDKKYTPKEAEVLDLCMVLHADHGANNSSFATHVVASSGTDTYSAITAAVGSLKGPKHGGANRQVAKMIEDIKTHCTYTDVSHLKTYLHTILKKQAFDGAGLIYGMGHPVYTLSDPRAEILKEKARELAIEKGREVDLHLYENIELLTKIIWKEKKGKPICANVDLYVSLVYDMIGIPEDLYTPIFAVSRVAGWCSHRMEQLLSDNKIIRPAYQFVRSFRPYSSLDKRK